MALHTAAAPHRRHRKAKQLLLCALVILVEVARVQGRHYGRHGSIEKLLAAGLIAKALAQQGEEGGEGGGGGHHYMPIHIPVHHGTHGRDNGGHHHHHVHHKYVPIPVKHHTNFIIAHHKVKVPVHVPVPMVKTKVVHVPVEKTKIVPIIVHKGHHHHPHHQFEHAGSSLHPKKLRAKGISALTPHHIALATNNGKKAVRITSLGTLRNVKGAASNVTSVKLERNKGVPDKWIVVVKSKRRRPSSLRRRTGDLRKSRLLTASASAPSPVAVKPPPLSR